MKNLNLGYWCALPKRLGKIKIEIKEAVLEGWSGIINWMALAHDAEIVFIGQDRNACLDRMVGTICPICPKVEGECGDINVDKFKACFSACILPIKCALPGESFLLAAERTVNLDRPDRTLLVPSFCPSDGDCEHCEDPHISCYPEEYAGASPCDGDNCDDCNQIEVCFPPDIPDAPEEF